MNIYWYSFRRYLEFLLEESLPTRKNLFRGWSSYLFFLSLVPSFRTLKACLALFPPCFVRLFYFYFICVSSPSGRSLFQDALRPARNHPRHAGASIDVRCNGHGLEQGGTIAKTAECAASGPQRGINIFTTRCY